jgi:hypothetical protein
VTIAFGHRYGGRRHFVLRYGLPADQLFLHENPARPAIANPHCDAQFQLTLNFSGTTT